MYALVNPVSMKTIVEFRLSWFFGAKFEELYLNSIQFISAAGCPIDAMLGVSLVLNVASSIIFFYQNRSPIRMSINIRSEIRALRHKNELIKI